MTDQEALLRCLKKAWDNGWEAGQLQLSSMISKAPSKIPNRHIYWEGPLSELVAWDVREAQARPPGHFHSYPL